MASLFHSFGPTFTFKGESFFSSEVVLASVHSATPVMIAYSSKSGTPNIKIVTIENIDIVNIL